MAHEDSADHLVRIVLCDWIRGFRTIKWHRREIKREDYTLIVGYCTWPQIKIQKLVKSVHLRNIRKKEALLLWLYTVRESHGTDGILETSEQSQCVPTHSPRDPLLNTRTKSWVSSINHEIKKNKMSHMSPLPYLKSMGERNEWRQNLDEVSEFVSCQKYLFHNAAYSALHWTSELVPCVVTPSRIEEYLKHLRTTWFMLTARDSVEENIKVEPSQYIFVQSISDEDETHKKEKIKKG